MVAVTQFILANDEYPDIPVDRATTNLRAAATGSSAKRWMECPASVSMGIGLPEVEKEWTTKGTSLHKEIAELLISQDAWVYADAVHRKDYKEEIAICLTEIFRYAPRGIDIDNPLHLKFYVEKRLPLLGSTGGLDLYFIVGKTAYLFDWKFGAGIKLSAFENEQIAFYACAIRERHPEVTTVHCVMVQPFVAGDFAEGEVNDEGDIEGERTANITSWTLPHQTLRMWRNRFERALNRVEESRDIKAGPWCRFCKAYAGCPAHLPMAELVPARMVETDIPIPPSDFGLEKGMILGTHFLPAMVPRIAAVLAAKSKITKWFSKAEDFLFAMGTVDPKLLEGTGFEISAGRGQREWALLDPENPSDEKNLTDTQIAQTLTERGIADPWKPRELINLTTAEKQCTINDLVVKEPGKKKIRPQK